jgi:hypothetical protein
MGRSITEFCGVRTETSPPGFKTDDPISPPGGYIAGLQINAPGSLGIGAKNSRESTRQLKLARGGRLHLPRCSRSCDSLERMASRRDLPLEQAWKFSVLAPKNITLSLCEPIRFTKSLKHRGQKLFKNEVWTCPWRRRQSG